MNHPDFTEIRRQVDEAITYDDLATARELAGRGLALAQEKECPGEAMYFTAQFAIIDEHHDIAAEFLKKAIQFNPQDGAAFNDLALCRVESGSLEGILELFDQGIAVEPDYATIHHNKGWFLNKLGQHADALECFRRALELDPARAVTYENMADAYEALGLFSEALDSYRLALKLIRVSSDRIRKQIADEIARLEKKK